MNRGLVTILAFASAAAALLLAPNVYAQTSSLFKVSNAIEGSNNPSGVSLARCGPGIVVGFGDREPGPIRSNAGVAISKNASLFSDVGTLADPSLTFGGGDSPVIACSGPAAFYYATLGFVEAPITSSSPCVVGCTEIEVSNSTTGGSTWGTALTASIATNDIYLFQSPSFAIDPSNSSREYAAYINHNFAQPNDFPGCDEGDLYILEVVASADGGKTWNGRSAQDPAATGNPSLQPDHACNSSGLDARHTGILVAPSVVVSPTGAIYVVYEFVGANINGTVAPSEIRITRSLDHGSSYSAPITISTDAINNALPTLAVDRTASASRGEVYVTWSGSPTGTYTDVLVSDSVNSGASFSFPRPISPAPAVGTGRFQSNPVIAVDNDGQVAACFYNTPTNSPTSSSVYAFDCATSFNHAASWTVRTVKSGVPVGYDAVISDFALHNDGFITVFAQKVNGVLSLLGQKFEMN